MPQATVFLSPVSSPITEQSFNTARLLSFLLILLLAACKSASIPTQAQTQAQSQSAIPGEQRNGSETHNPSTTSSKTSHTSPVLSNEEIIGDVDSELDASIAVFDGMILEERTKAEAIEASLGGGDVGSEQGDGSSESGLFEDGDIYEGLPGYGEFPGDSGEGESNGEASGESTASADGSDDGAASGGSDSPGGLETTRRGAIPEDIKGGSDDDIVARQIREAALKEKDPVLREKLWDEYRKYKNQQ